MKQNRLAGILIDSIEHAATVLMILILVLSAIQVAARDLLRISVPWTEEGTRYLQVAMVFWGGIVAVSKDANIRLILGGKLSAGSERFLDFLSEIFTLAISVVYIIGSWILIGMNWHISTVALAPLPTGILYVFSLIGAVGMALVSLARGIAVLRRRPSTIPAAGGK